MSGTFKPNYLGFNMNGSTNKNIGSSLTPYGGAITDAVPQSFSNGKVENGESGSGAPNFIANSNYVSITSTNIFALAKTLKQFESRRTNFPN